ncbi:YodL domain-containing protein [Ruminococcus bicirculans]|uniref:YodL domain-containing protein n=2 Tax=Ruminococcus bicirculans (ex Wegman et al. 2014) TaxID=1160721 RepID=A0AAW6EAB7_9FIRM|nr:YodL domain-containing protein [Ruminococcus bicirculans (ex Wegman et al. 2014)]MDB8746068.1 YodL domain-containing protein [Ruminococcus bicirculans (ex Wegman et al. 2014)]MDB8748785.1 YodL domain-containing protein [Ruminococcus bicirculans (ex Wegman et al. 2014)]MDB8754130.1 YodL domain-containing protein [Ruminococcus bicirculans (ex Wegman et al. 2014)]
MRITDEQKEKANLVNLPKFLMSHGFDLKKVGREYVWKDHDSLHIKDNGPGERGQWFRFRENKGGDNIGFLREYMDMSFIDAVEALTGEHIDRTYTPSRTYESKPVQQTARELSLAEADNSRRVFAYLCKTRGLDYDMLSALVKKGTISQEEKTGNVLFKYFGTDGKVIGAEKVGTSTEHKFKGIATSSAGGHGFEVVRGTGEKAFFFESAIDMLSYLQMHDQELDNCRLVSMMGVKPNIVLDTMLRHNISPENVFLCSDNDTAGNDFAQRLQEQYPDMKRVITPDTYKDWNDMLRGIPKAVEHETDKKEVQQTDMQRYGNEMWHKATDNRDKSLVTIQTADFERLQEQLDDSGINYYAYARDNSVIMAINDKDVEWFRQIAGTPDLLPNKSNRPYSPPEKNIFGSTEYRYIPQKEYLSADRDLVLKMAEIMAKRGMQFSGRVYPSGKGTLTVSHADLFAVRNIRDEVVNMRKQFASPDKAQEVGNRDYRANRDTHYYMSKLTPEQFKEVKPFLETSVSYHAVVRDGKVAFAVDKENAPAFHRALENAVRETNMLRKMADLGLPMEQNIALSPVVHRLAVEDMQLDLADFFDSRYDEAQFGEMLSLVNAYLSQALSERYGEHSKLHDMLEAKSSFDRSIELSDFFSQHDFSDGQRAAITAMFVGDVTRGQIDSIDETFTAEDIQAYDEILHNALQESDVADFLTAHKQAVIDRENASRVLTEEEVLFPKADLAKFLAERTLSSDEWEDMAYPLFDSGYLDKHKPSDKAAFGYHLSEPALYDLAQRYHDGEDIRRELALGLLEGSGAADIEFIFEQGEISDRTYYYAENLRHSLHTERTEDGFKCSFSGMERFVSFEEIGQAFIDRTHEEFNDLAFWWVRDDMLDAIPDISDENISDLLTAFDGAALHGWENGDNIPKLNRIKKALYDILGDEAQTEKAFAIIAKEKYHVSFDAETPEKKPDSLSFHFDKDKGDEWVSESDIVHDFALAHPDCSFALGNAVLEYLDEKQHSERNIPELKAGWYKKTDFSITAVINGEEFNYDGRFDIGDGKGTGGGSLIDHIRTYNEGILGYTQHPFNQPEYKERAQRMLDIFVPFLEAHSELTAEEQRIFDDFKAHHPIRTYDDVEKAQGKFQIYQLPGGEKYHGVRFEDMEQLKKNGVQLNHDDYELVYEGEVGEFRGNATLEALYTQFNTKQPEDFRGHSLSVSDVIVISVDGKDTAYFCDSFGFTEMPEFFREKELVQEKPETAKVSDLAVGDIIMYDGARREVEEISTDRIKMKDLDAPDYGGILLGTSDVLAYDGWQQDMEEKGFEIISKAEKPAVEAPEQAEPEDKGPVSLRKVGDFYEMYGKNAEVGAEVLGLRMLSKNGQPMVGFPDHVKDEYSAKLREAGYTVLIEQAFELNPPKREAEKLQTLQQVVDKFFGTDCESAETERGTWKLAIADGDKVGELFYGGEPVCGIYNRGDKMEIEPYRELTTFPALLRTAMLKHNPDKSVEIMDFQRTFETPLDKAKWLINDFCEAEYREGADFDDLHNVGLAFTTLTDDELPIQVTADLIDFKITHEFDGEVFDTEQFDSIEDMIENGLTDLDFSDLVSVPDEVIERHTGKDEQTVELMSDAADVSDTSSPAEDVPSVTLKYKGDAESLDEIKDKALSLGATVIVDNAEGVISIDTYADHKAELDGLAYELGVMAVDDVPAVETPTAETEDIDRPLFTDAAVIDEIQRNENADVPFWEMPEAQGEQLSLFGDSEPLTASKPAPEKPKSEFAKGPVVDGVQVYEALAAEIDRGTGFVHGKLRVQDFYEEQHPTVQQLADFLKKEYGTGGHSGEGKISLVDYDSKGLTFSFENGEKFRHSWYNVATMTESRLRDDTYLSAEQKAERAALKAEQSAEKQSPHTVEVGDRFSHKITGEVSEVISLTGALPFYTDDCTVQRDSGGFAITENISYDKLLNSGLYEYIGKAEPEKAQSAPVKSKPAVNPEAEKPEIPTVKNLSQLKKAIKPGMMFEITDHLRPECIGERRIVTGVSTVDFTSRKLDENGEPMGKDLHMDFDRAKNWAFDGGELTSRLDNGDMLMSFHFIDSLEREQTVHVDKEHELAPEKTAPELSVGDYLEYRGKEYKVESLDMDGFITLTDTALEDAPRLISRVTFLTDEFIRSGEYMVITPEKGEVEAPAPDKGDNFTITDDTLGEGGAKTKFRANVDAIRTLKTLEAEKRPATAEEKETLSKYVGWGALAKAFDKNDEKWAAEYKELSELLTPQEYAQARSTVNDAFYTSPTVIDGIYEALANFGFEGGNVLEPAMGIGNFFGRMPEDMQAHSQLYGVEIDSLSGRIAQALYPDADIAIQGFEKNRFQNGSFDVAVGNVPFGELGFRDTVHDTTKLHDYFFAEALSKLKDGGIMAFVTSAGTLDKRDETTRQMLADKADFIGAIRLPGGKNGAFKDNAGTEVTTDIIFLKKHEGKSLAEMSDIPDWVHIGETADGLPINKYFEQHPDMVLGTVVEGNKLYGSGTMVVAEDGFDLKSALHEAVGKLSAEISHERGRDVYAKTADGVQVQIPSNLRNYSFFMSDDQVFFKKNNAACEFRFDKGTAQHKRFKAFIELRDLTRELIEAMELDKPDAVIKDLQAKLNVAYDDFYKKFGLIHSQTNKRYFAEDVSYNLVAGLEKSYDKTKLLEKSDIFTKRTIVPPKAVEHVDTALEALTLSIAEKARVDFEYMSSLTGMTEDELKHDLTGNIFKIPHTENEYQTASEYLSGDIRKKLREAEEIAEYDPDFNINVSALKQAMPEPLKAGDIDIKLGAAWLDPKYYEQFMYELLQTPAYQRSDSPSARWNKSAIVGVEYSVHANSFHVSNKSSDRSVLATQKYGTHKMNAYDIFEHLLNLQEPKVYKTIEVPDGLGDTKEKRVVDIDATRVVQRKADDIRKAFKAWIFKDSARREAIVERYNELFNSIRPREFDGSALSFPMMTADIHLHDHQKNAIAHAMFGGNTLFAHCVGAGKTFEMIATAMESKRLGLCTKSLFAVPNHLTEQIGDDFQKLYPGANILVATKKDFKKENRQQLFAKIATGNYDAVIIGHSQLGKIPVSKERQVMTIQSQIDDILRGIEELKKSEGSKFQIKAMERTRKSLQKQLDKLEKANQDDTLTFEQLGIDRLFVDEAHEFKNLFVATKLQNVAGISNSASQKALDLFLKCRYLDEKTGGKGVIFATGTPLSNSITELHTMMRYLEYDFLRDHGLQHFDNWVAVFGDQKTDWELKPAGNGFKERTRIANYTGLPELMSMFKQVADIRTADTLTLDVPDCDYQVVQVEATPFQQELVQELADRADAINAGNVDPTIDNMLKITSDGRKLGLDPRLIDPSFEDNPDTKLNRCVENVARIHAETAEDRLTQIIFCDLGVPHKAAGEAEVEGEDADDVKDKKSIAEVESLEEECDFCVYDDIRDKLIARGIPAEEIAYIHDAKTEQQKADLFDKVRSGEIRVLLGSTAKMGTGTNVQKKLIAVHDLDIPWRPADLEQRAGRIIRQGNENKQVQIFRYVTKGTFDAYSYQTLENKQKFISQIMTSKTPARKCEDVDQQALTYSEIKALCTGDERIKEKLMLENEVKELRVLAAEHRNTVFEMEDKIARFPEQEQKLTAILADLHTDREALRKLPIDPERKLPVFKITIGETEYTDRKEAAKALEDAVLAIKYADTPVKVGSFQGFDLSVTVNSNMMGGGMSAGLQGATSHTTKLIDSFAHNLNRLEAALYNIDGRIERTQDNLAKLRLDHAEAQKIVAEPFPQQEELDTKEQRLKVVTDELNQAAIEAKKNAPKREKTCYFERAKMKRDAARLGKKPKTPKDQTKGRSKKQGIE